MSHADFGLQPVVSPAPQRSVPPRELRDLRDLASIDLVRTASTLPASPIDRDTQVQLCLPLPFLALRMPCLSITSRSRWLPAVSAEDICLCPSLLSEGHVSLSHPGAGGCRQLAQKTFASAFP